MTDKITARRNGAHQPGEEVLVLRHQKLKKGYHLSFKPFDLLMSMPDGAVWHPLVHTLRTDYYMDILSLHPHIETIKSLLNLSGNE